MRLRLTRAARINHAAGEIVEVSPDQARFLISLGSAEIVAEKKPKPKKEKPVDEPEE